MDDCNLFLKQIFEDFLSFLWLLLSAIETSFLQWSHPHDAVVAFFHDELLLVGRTR
jgi:hypothetical protein